MTTFLDYARCPKADAGLCRKGMSWMVLARDLEGGCKCPLRAWQVHCTCGYVSTPCPSRLDAEEVGRGHVRIWHPPDTESFDVQLAPDAPEAA